MRAPSWSPDGRRIAFEASIAGNSDIFVIDADGGEPKRLTVEASIDGLPNWSQDGRTIFFTSDRSGRREVWKMGSDGGAARQVTRNGGFEPIPSFDGASIYYLQQAAACP